jgi:hypothetical protein
MEQNLTQLVSFLSHIKWNILDLIIANNLDRVLDVSDVGRLGKSDHCMIEIIVEGNVENLSQNKEKHNWGRADLKKIREEVDRAQWEVELDTDTVNRAWTRFKNILNEIMDRRRRQNRMKRQPWMTGEIMRQIRKKRRYWTTRRKGRDTVKSRKRQGT